MPENKRSRKYSKQKGNSNLVTGKNDSKSTKKGPEETIQPKILIKARPPQANALKEPLEVPKPQNTITIQTKEKEQSQTNSSSEHSTPVSAVPVQLMTRSIALSNLTNPLATSGSARIFDKTNNDFFVIGVMGTQGVGKSTLMNLLVPESIDSTVYNKYFKRKEGTFTIKSKVMKTPLWLESMDLFITKDRIIFIDCPPVLTGSYRKDVKTIESDDLKMIIFLLTVCHLVIFVQDDYFNLSLIRLLQFSEFTKPSNMKSTTNDNFPNILFIKNKGSRIDFQRSEKDKKERLIKYVFKNSLLKIFVGQTDKNGTNRSCDQEFNNINYFVFPDVKDGKHTPFYRSLEEVCNEFRLRVFSTPRNQIHPSCANVTEMEWFELAKCQALNKSNFFLTFYEEIRRFQLHTESDQ